MRWFERQRMAWLETRTEPFVRKDLMSSFDISAPQTSIDIQKFVKANPDRLKYNLSLKRYEVQAALSDEARTGRWDDDTA